MCCQQGALPRPGRRATAGAQAGPLRSSLPPPCTSPSSPPRPPHNTNTAVGQFRELVETAECNKSLRETLKQARVWLGVCACCWCVHMLCQRQWGQLRLGLDRQARQLTCACMHACTRPPGPAPHQGLGRGPRPRAQGSGDGCAAARVPPRCAAAGCCGAQHQAAVGGGVCSRDAQQADVLQHMARPCAAGHGWAARPSRALLAHPPRSHPRGAVPVPATPCAQTGAPRWAWCSSAGRSTSSTSTAPWVRVLA